MEIVDPCHLLTKMSGRRQIFPSIQGQPRLHTFCAFNLTLKGRTHVPLVYLMYAKAVTCPLFEFARIE